MDYSKQTYIAFFLIFSITATLALDLTIELKLNFYSQRCSNAESIVKSTVKKHFDLNPTVAPGLLRMHFHDCFVRGCDASVLIDGTDTEKTALPNLSLRGYEVIHDAKSQLETSCPGVVSCADILALAARDAVVLTTGLTWGVPMGRLDGTVSSASEVFDHLPGFTDSVNMQKAKFSAKGLGTQDLVALVGGHSIGTSACAFFSYRLYNYNSTGGPDPSIDSTFLPTLRNLCPQNGNGSIRVGLDNGSSGNFDASFFKNLKNGRGVLESDQKLWSDSSTKTLVKLFLPLVGSRNLVFNAQFAHSMVKMGKIGVKMGTVPGYEVRTNCSRIN